MLGAALQHTLLISQITVGTNKRGMFGTLQTGCLITLVDDSFAMFFYFTVYRFQAAAAC